MPRHDRHRLARRKRSLNHPALLFVRPVSPDARNGLKRPFHQALSADQRNASPQEKLLFSTTLCTGGQKTTLTKRPTEAGFHLQVLQDQHGD
jgi:hypothetical protein